MAGATYREKNTLSIWPLGRKNSKCIWVWLHTFTLPMDLAHSLNFKHVAPDYLPKLSSCVVYFMFDSLQLQIVLLLEGDQSDPSAASLAKWLQLEDSYWCRGDISRLVVSLEQSKGFQCSSLFFFECNKAIHFWWNCHHCSINANLLQQRLVSRTLPVCLLCFLHRQLAGVAFWFHHN